MSVPRVLVGVRCVVCEARREVAEGAELPECGELHSEMTRFPDGGWLRTEQWEPHGTMVFTGGVRAGNPLQAQVDAAAVAVRRRALADNAASDQVYRQEVLRRG